MKAYVIAAEVAAIEASRHIPVDMKAKEPKINWRRLADLGNWLRHAYHRTDPGRKCRSKLSEPRSKKLKPLWMRELPRPRYDLQHDFKLRRKPYGLRQAPPVHRLRFAPGSNFVSRCDAEMTSCKKIRCPTG